MLRFVTASEHLLVSYIIKSCDLGHCCSNVKMSP